MTNTINQITATIESINEKGVKVNGEWSNFSKFAAPEAIEPASRGDLVLLEVDGKGFVRRLEVVGADRTNVAHLPDDDAPMSNEDAAADAMELAGMGSLSQKDILIIRQSSVRGAIDFAASRPDMKAADVFKLAECIERWVCR